MSIQLNQPSGQQTDDQKIYSQYTDISAYIDSLINALDQKYNSSHSDPKYLQERAALVALKQNPASFLSAYQKDYQIAHDPNATQAARDAAASDFDAIYTKAKAAADAIVGGGGSDPKTQIQNDQASAEKLKAALDQEIEQDQKAVDTLTGQIAAWQKQITALEANPASQSDPAKSDLAAAKAKLTALETQVSALKTDISSLTGLQTKEATDISQFSALLANPTADNAKKADALLSDLKGVDSQAEAAQQDFTSKTPSAADITAMSAAITKVQDDLDPSAGIQKDQKDAQAVIDAMKAATAQDQKALDALDAQIAAWTKQIATLKANPSSQKDPAKTDLAAANAMLAKLQAARGTANNDLTTLKSNLTTATTDLGQFSTITTKAAADALLAKISALNTQSQFTKDMPSKVQTDAMSAAIAKVQSDLNPTPAVSGDGFESYIETWDPNAAEDIANMPLKDGMTFNFAFSGWNNLDPDTEKTIETLSKQLLARAAKEGVKVNIKLSVGGQSDPMPSLPTPEAANALADKISGWVSDFKKDGVDLSGVDLDIEGCEQDNLANGKAFILDLRKKLGPDKLISLTVPGQGWKGQSPYTYGLASDPDVQNAVSYIQFMEFDIWKGDGTSYVNQIKNDFSTYATPKGQPGAGDDSTQMGWGIPKDKLRLGLLPGEDDPHVNSLSSADAKALAAWTVQQKFNGVMIWNSDRDGGTSTSGDPSTGEPAWAFTKAILDGLAPQSSSKTNIDQAYQTAKDAVGKLNGEIVKDSSDLKALVAQEKADLQQIKELTTEVGKLPAGSAKDKAVTDLAALNSKLVTLQADIGAAQTALGNLQTALGKAISTYTELSTLHKLANPTSDDAATAQKDLQTIQGIVSPAEQGQTAFRNTNIAAVTTDAGDVTTAIGTVKSDLNPNHGIDYFTHEIEKILAQQLATNRA